jgi:hypothetical protein
MMKKLGLVAVLAFLPFATMGCSKDCPALCEAANEECPTQQTADCQKNCDDSKALAEQAGCSNEWDDALDCKRDLGNLCDGPSCYNSLTACMIPYCTAHVQECQAVQ